MKKNQITLSPEIVASIRTGDNQIANQYKNSLDRDGRSPLFYSILDNDLDMLISLISVGADVNLQDKSGWTPLHFAVELHNLEAISLLFLSGASIEIADNYGNTPLWRAVMASKGKGEAIMQLLELGANAYTKNNSGISPYDLAAGIANYNIVQFFNH